ncbi:VOC family protein [Streptomyces qinzhouensis]|uniref:VOC family protein n=1 Tax=Streptomyces qinzhouensis TaxID=2599401 RepID=A0A5B8J8S6_9ACTN|nr:VOC family protein [Streptomyces qinzhouensis]QDY77666.1 VOC family protein [Streptomyces qinzhouensis]
MIRWVCVFVDRPRERFEVAAEFWTAVTGTRLSPRRGEYGEYATFLPDAAVADPYVKLQGVGAWDDGLRGSHIDFAVDDVSAFTARAVSAGADIVVEYEDCIVLASPAGQAFCAVPWQGESRRPDLFGGIRLDQVSVDIPPQLYERETAFWSALTGWPLLYAPRSEYRAVQGPVGLPVRILLQRLDEPRAVGAHLDFSAADRAASAVAHEKLGATVVEVFDRWTVLRDPAGGLYCLTDRDPATSLME